jgi:hypothetical protein
MLTEIGEQVCGHMGAHGFGVVCRRRRTEGQSRRGFARRHSEFTGR